MIDHLVSQETQEAKLQFSNEVGGNVALLSSRTRVIVGLVVVAVGLLIAFVYYGQQPDKTPRTASSSPSPSHVAPTLRVVPPGAPTGNASAVLYEIRNSTDVGATYEKYRSTNDPQVAFVLSRAIGDCMSFVDKTPEQVSSSMNSVGKRASDSPQRAKVIQRLIDRCKGFSGWGDGGIYSAAKILQTKAIDAGNPAAVAQSLWVGFASGKVEELDAKAKDVLNAGNIDGDVVKGVYDYLLRRNGNEWLSQYGDPAIMAAAWALLQCNYGSDCSGNNRTLVMSCVYLAACEQTDVASLLPLQYPSLTPEKMQQAIQAEELLGSQIQSRDWARLGFGWSGKSSSPK